MDGLCNLPTAPTQKTRLFFGIAIPQHHFFFFSCLSVKPHGSSERRHKEFQPSLEVSRNLTSPPPLPANISLFFGVSFMSSRQLQRNLSPPWHYPPQAILEAAKRTSKKSPLLARRWPVHHLLGPCRPGPGLNLHCPVLRPPSSHSIGGGARRQWRGGQGTDSRFNSAGLDSGSRPARTHNES